MSELLIELFSEEIPARMQARASEDLKRLVVEGLAAAGLKVGEAMAFATPRRLALLVQGVPAGSPAISEERKGPRVGAPEQAIQGFLKGAGLASIADAAVVEDTKKGNYYVARIDKPGRSAAAIVAEVLEHTIRTFPWPKSQRWGSGDLRWVRPLKSIICLLDGRVVQLVIEAIEAGNRTRGHRFHGNDPFEVGGFEDYAKKLKARKVLLLTSERIEMIREQAREIAKAAKLEWIEDESLLAENAGLTEWPTVLMGSFDEEFLSVPPECLITSMKTHQKCFSLRDPKTKALANRFLLVSNLVAADGGKTIVAGNEKVIRARLSDAKFFWEQDLKRKLEPMHFELKGITFHEKLGTQWDRMERITELARQIAGAVDAEPDLAGRAAQLCKADLVSGMVGEFPELQGLMGRYYAEAEKMDAKVARAIELHYKPKGPSDTVPKEEDGDAVAIAVALADKLDTLVGFWAIGEKPTGSGDPYQLRRAALGVIRIVLENDLRLGLRQTIRGWVAAGVATWRPQTGYRSLASNVDVEPGSPVYVGPSWDDQPYYALLDHDGFLTRSAGDIRFAQIGQPNVSSFADQEEYEARALKLKALRKRLELLGGEVEHPAYGFVGSTRSTELEALRLESRAFLDAIGDAFYSSLSVFFADRLKVYLREQGRRHDLIDAVFALPGQDDLALIVKRVEALDAFLKSDDGTNLLAGIKRASNILAIEEKKDKTTHAGDPDVTIMSEPAEKALFAAIEKAKFDTRAAIDVENFTGAMNALADLRAPVDTFFDKVTVNVTAGPDAPAIRRNRLKLLSEIRAATLQVADFSRIAGSAA